MLEKRAPLEWYKDGVRIYPADSRIQLKYDENSGKQQLIITNAEMDDAGEYTAKAKDCKTSCKVTVLEGEKKPVLSPEKTDYQGTVNQPLTVEIPYKGLFLLFFIGSTKILTFGFLF